MSDCRALTADMSSWLRGIGKGKESKDSPRVSLRSRLVSQPA